MHGLSSDHAHFLAATAIPKNVAESAGAYSVMSSCELPTGFRWDGPGIVFQLCPLDGPPVPQYRPDSPTPDAKGRLRKYVFPAGPAPLNIVPDMRARIGSASWVLIVEGTRQTLAAIAYAPSDVLVIGMAGCWGWSRDKLANPELGRLGIAGLPVVIALDADVATNPDVHDAGARLGTHLEVLGAKTVKFVALPAGPKIGLDDYLANAEQVDRANVLARLVDMAEKLGRRPKAIRHKSPLLDTDGGIRADAALAAIRAEHHLCLDRSGRVATYSDGVYRADRTDAADWGAILTGLLGDAYRPQHARTLTEYAQGRLRAEGRVASDDPHPGLVNVANGMLDPLTGLLHDHDPAHLSLVQLPVAWDPSATCPTFDGWLPTVVGDGLVEDLLESASQLLETRPNRQQRRALFLHGPSRSGKSTFLRILEHLVGPHRSAVTLGQLARDTFAAADLAGSILNSAADLSAAHLEDLSTFKALTGDDLVRAQRKYGQPFIFHARCLFVFSANSIPTASEVTTAYLNRIRPFPFPNSFASHEDPTIEDQLVKELSGILVRLQGAYHAHAARGAYLETPATRRAADEFAQASDRVRLFLAEATQPVPHGGVPRTELWRAFERWCADNRRNLLGKHKFYEVVRSAGLGVGKNGAGTVVIRGITLRPDDEWGPPEASTASLPASASGPKAEVTAAPGPGDPTGHTAVGTISSPDTAVTAVPAAGPRPNDADAAPSSPETTVPPGDERRLRQFSPSPPMRENEHQDSDPHPGDDQPKTAVIAVATASERANQGEPDEVIEAVF
ncbi:MAG: hypothetical protein JWN46_1991 [Acidimicrobiales bacterium]|nr:hypothetical protein [Acidimicrobiales bacterium]